MASVCPLTKPYHDNAFTLKHSLESEPLLIVLLSSRRIHFYSIPNLKDFQYFTFDFSSHNSGLSTV